MGTYRVLVAVASSVAAIYLIGFLVFVPIAVSNPIRSTSWMAPILTPYMWIWDLEEADPIRIEASRYVRYWCRRYETCESPEDGRAIQPDK